MSIVDPRMSGLFAVPVRSLSLLTLIAVTMVGAAVLLLQPLPWIGASFAPAPAGNGLEVTDVHPDGPAAGHLIEGEVVGAVRTAEGGWIDLAGYRPGLEPHGLLTFAALHGYLERQGRLFDVLRGESVTLATRDGVVTLPLEQGRPLASLPAAFWLFHGFGGIALLLGGAVWLSRRERLDAALLAISGCGFFLATWTNSLYLVRELAFPAGAFDLALRANHLAMTVMIGAILLLFVHYPRPATVRWPSILIVVILLGYQANENLLQADWSLHSFYAPLVLMYALALALAYRQWRLSADTPVDRASLRWVFLAILMTMGICMVVYFLPPILGRQALLPQVAMVGFAMLMYLGLALGVIRYRLFQLERWWFEIWFWFLAGVMLLLVDLGLVWLIHLEQFQALGLGLILVGWIYFPLRHLAWRRLMRKRQDTLVDLLPRLVDGMFNASTEREMESRWPDMLRRAFSPLEASREDGRLEGATLVRNGEGLQVPGLFDGRWILRHAGSGQRLFTSGDASEADSLRLVARQVCEVRYARAQGAVAERKRIVRDLHDDVGNRLLSLVRFSETPHQERLARSTLDALRESMEALDPGREYGLGQIFLNIKDDVRERFPEQAGSFVWDLHASTSSLSLRPRQAINIRRILDEAIGNALEHADPSRVEMACRLDDGLLTLRVENDGLQGEKERGQNEGVRGRGMKNMQTRAEEIGAHIGFQRRDGGFRVDLEWPVGHLGQPS